jgi:putative FmdB family regulatory protein
MPFYEYLCPSCNRIFTFLSQRINPEQAPACPKCQRKNLKKVMSRFGLIGAAKKSKSSESAAKDETGSDTPAGPDPMENPAVMREMEKLMTAAEGMDENDPRQLGRLMRRMSEITGEKLDGGMAEAVRRLEAGEDPEKVEASMEGELGEDTGGLPGGAPSYDDDVYSM